MLIPPPPPLFSASVVTFATGEIGKSGPLDCAVGSSAAFLLALLLAFPMVTPLLKTVVTLSITLPLMILDMLARAAGCLAAAHTGFLRNTTPGLAGPPSACLLGGAADAAAAGEAEAS